MAGNRHRGATSAVSGLVAVLSLVLLTGGCSQKKGAAAAGTAGSAASAGSSAPVPSTPSTPPAVVRFNPATGAAGVDPLEPIRVAVAGGSLSDVTVTNGAGTAVKGALSADKLSWASAEELGYDKSYTIKAVATNADGDETTQASSFTTVKPHNLTMPYLQTAAGGAIDPGVTFGVGQVVRVHFDEAIPDRKAAQATLQVTTVPDQTGAFSWLSDRDVYWRTRTYLTPGTKVTITAKAYGKNFGNSLYGQADSTTWFKVGNKHISIADDRNKIVRVYSNGTLVKTMPTSMGRHTSIKGDTGMIDLRTNSGPHVVVGGEKNIDMNSASFGLSKGANAYRTTVPVGVRISYDGEYVHWADWSVRQQGKTDTSHGCLNVSPANAYWFYGFSVPGDIVDVRNTGRTLAEWNSGYWNVSWATWISDSAT